MTPNGSPIPQLSEIDAWRTISASNLALQFEHIARSLGRRWVRWDGLWAADTSLPVAYPNSATMLQPIAEQEAADVVTRLDHFYAGGIGGSWMLWSAWPTPDLTPYGMHPAGQTPLMVRLPTSSAVLPVAAPTGLRIVEAST